MLAGCASFDFKFNGSKIGLGFVSTAVAAENPKPIPTPKMQPDQTWNDNEAIKKRLEEKFKPENSVEKYPEMWDPNWIHKNYKYS
jgi:hypothetical protein